MDEAGGRYLLGDHMGNLLLLVLVREAGRCVAGAGGMWWGEGGWCHQRWGAGAPAATDRRRLLLKGAVLACAEVRRLLLC